MSRNDPPICPDCRKPARNESLGTLTHWLLACSCGLATTNDDIQRITVNFCRTCGKRIGRGRDGSLTSYILRHDYCKCATPKPFAETVELRKEDFILMSHDLGDWEDEEEIEVSPDLFPVERFKPISELGRGASGIVWLARDRLLKKLVAVKVLNVIDRRYIVSFQEEARTTSRLQHENIVRILDFGLIDSSRPYLVLEFLPGLSIKYLLKRDGPLPVNRVRQIFRQICDALQYANDRGIYHRDLQPNNILVIEDDQGNCTVKLIDFGIAKIRERTADPTGIEGAYDTMAGSPAYMSPDVSCGRGYDSRSEVYSVGCVLYESITGEPPFQADTPLQILSMHANDPVPQVPDNLESTEAWQEILNRALAKTPEKRFAGPKDLGEAIASLGQKGSDQAGSSHAPRESPGAGLRTVMSLASIICAALLVYISLAQSRQQESQKKRPQAVQESGPAEMLFFDDRIPRVKWQCLGEPPDRVYMAMANCTDDDFEQLKGFQDVTNIGLFGMNENITGTGARHLKGLNILALGLPTTKLTDEGLDAISELTSLKALSLEWNTSLTEKGIEHLRKLTNLDSLALRYMKLPSNTLRSVSEMSSLTDLVISSSEPFNHEELGLLTRLKKLRNLTLLDEKITDDDCKVLARLQNLQTLVLKNNPVTDRGVPSIASMKLRILELSGTLITDRALVELAECKSLEKLKLVNCKGLSSTGLDRLKKSLPHCQVKLKSEDPGAIVF